MAGKYAIWGTGGMARDIRVSCVLSIRRSEPEVDEPDIVFVDEDPERCASPVNGTRVITPDELKREGDRQICVSIAAPRERREIVERCEREGYSFFSIVDPTHRQFDAVSVGIGAILAHNTLITSNVTIGRHFHGNIYSYVEHDCRIGDFVTFGPRVSCNGNILIEDGAYVGCNAVIKQGTRHRPLVIGAGAVIGMGAVVTRDVPPGATVVGNPARPLQR